MDVLQLLELRQFDLSLSAESSDPLLRGVCLSPTITNTISYAECWMESEPEGHIETHSQDGVDLTLIRWMLSLTPAERLDVLQRHVSSILSIRENRDED